MQLRDGETVGEYIMRLENRLKELEPPDGFTVQEWHVGQVYAYLLWLDDSVQAFDEAAIKKWRDRLAMFEERFASQVTKFKDYMGWSEKQETS